MTGFTWDRFSMVFAGDAQMENWAQYDSDGMLARKCKIFRTAQHGSMNGTQWKRLEKLSPGTVIISSDPDGHDKLSDLVGALIFRKYDIFKKSRINLMFPEPIGINTSGTVWVRNVEHFMTCR